VGIGAHRHLGTGVRLNATLEDVMEADKFNMSLRKFLKQVGVTSQQQIENLVRENLSPAKASSKSRWF
jgi:hypothetical protein